MRLNTPSPKKTQHISFQLNKIEQLPEEIHDEIEPGPSQLPITPNAITTHGTSIYQPQPKR